MWAIDFQRALQARQAARQAEVLDIVKSALRTACAQHLPRLPTRQGARPRAWASPVSSSSSSSSIYAWQIRPLLLLRLPLLLTYRWTAQVLERRERMTRGDDESHLIRSAVTAASAVSAPQLTADQLPGVSRSADQ